MHVGMTHCARNVCMMWHRVSVPLQVQLGGEAEVTRTFFSVHSSRMPDRAAAGCNNE